MGFLGIMNQLCSGTEVAARETKVLYICNDRFTLPVPQQHAHDILGSANVFQLFVLLQMMTVFGSIVPSAALKIPHASAFMK
jgi:hypothetical protein